MTWTLKAMFAGVHPTVDWNGIPFDRGTGEFHIAGQPLCPDADFFFVLWIINGDIDWFAKRLHLRPHNAVRPCDWCSADKHGDSKAWPTYFGSDATWMSELTRAPEWRESNEATLHMLFRELPYLSNMNIEPDELHVLHLGTSQYFLGSVLYLLVFTILDGTPAANMDTV